MKKLLSLLSVLTISGTSVPTTIAASPYEKQQKLNSDINSDINYSQTNNLESLSRIKRENNKIKTKVVKVGEWDSKKFLSDLCDKTS